MQKHEDHYLHFLLKIKVGSVINHKQATVKENTG